MADIPEWLQKLSDPAAWRRKIDDAADHEKRRKWMDQVKTAKDFVRNEIDPGIQTVENIYWYKTASYIRIRNYVLGRLAFGEMKPKVIGVELPDENLARMYELGINWEFTRPRGGNRLIGRHQITPCLMNWVDFGMGDINVRFDPYRVDRENYTGSIITEAADVTGLILDPEAPSLDRIRYLGRKFDVSEEEFRGILPAYDGDIPTDKDNRTTLYEVQFRTDRPVEVRFNSPEISEYIIDSRPYWKSEEEFKNAFIAGLNQRKSEDKNFRGPYHPNIEAEKIWKSFKRQYIALPMTYSMLFIGTEGKSEKLVDGPHYIGDNFSHVLIPFVQIYGTPYPVGAPFYVADMQKLEMMLKTLFVRSMLKANNSNIVVNLSKIDDPKQIETLKKFRAEIGGVLPIKNVDNIDRVFRQLEVKPPHQAILDLAKYIRWDLDEFFNTHEPMTGLPPFAGASGELTKVLQAAGSYPLGILVDDINQLLSGIFRRIARLIYQHMPHEKRIMISDQPGQMDQMTLKREVMRKADPNDFDIKVEVDTDSEQDKANKFNKAILLFDRGLHDPLTTLEDAGKKREAQQILSRLKDYQTGQQFVELMKKDKDFASQVDAYVKMKALETEEGES